jgi:cysteinyl-tRNA synthetase
MTSKRSQPSWSPPTQASEGVKLKLYNSLTRSKEEFIPQDRNRVTWYNCGPTVYDASHMGHARTYLSFDILRRVLQDYFGYNIFYVMNITDVDDKIIKRARQNHLFEEYVAKDPSLEKLLADCDTVLKRQLEIVKVTADPDKKAMQERQIAKLTAALTAVEASVKSGAEDKIAESKKELLASAKDLLADWLDQQFGASVKDNAIFSKLPRYWEMKYHEDMSALNVRNTSFAKNLRTF